MTERFLSVRLSSHHLEYARAVEPPDALVLELLDGQWGLYYLAASGKIQGCSLVKTLAEGMALAGQQFGVQESEWGEDFSN